MRLNMETRAQHPEADYPWLELMSHDASRTGYVDQLVATYGFEAPVEAAFQLTPYLGQVIPLRPRGPDSSSRIYSRLVSLPKRSRGCPSAARSRRFAIRPRRSAGCTRSSA